MRLLRRGCLWRDVLLPVKKTKTRWKCAVSFFGIPSKVLFCKVRIWEIRHQNPSTRAIFFFFLFLLNYYFYNKIWRKVCRWEPRAEGSPRSQTQPGCPQLYTHRPRRSSSQSIFTINLCSNLSALSRKALPFLVAAGGHNQYVLWGKVRKESF